jgi:hypothetical protein
MPYKDIHKRREAHKRYYYKNVAKYLEKNNRRKKLLISFIHELKQKPCMDCGVMYPPYVMDFDHREANTKVSSIARLVGDNRSKKKLLEELEKCDLICANCHRIRTHNRIIAE